MKSLFQQFAFLIINLIMKPKMHKQTSQTQFFNGYMAIH